MGVKNRKVAAHRSEYVIKFTGLPLGVHEYNFEIGDKFFEGVEESIISAANVKVLAVLHKGSGAMQLDLDLDGIVSVECGRCLEEYSLPIDVQKHLLIRMVEKPSREDDDDDSIHIGLSDHEIDLKEHLYDFLTLEVPYLPLHEDNEDGTPGCNPEVLKLITNRTEPSSEPKPEEPTNDRWEALRKLKMN